MGREGIWLYNEKDEPYYAYYDELDPEQLESLASPIGGFCYEANHFKRLPLPFVPYYIKDWLPKQGKCLIYAPAKAGKSTLAVQIARCIGVGEPFLGIPTQQGSVLYIQCELGTKVLQDRLNKTGQAYDNVFVGTSFSLKLDTTSGQRQLQTALDTICPNVLIIDPLYKVISGDENESADMRKICDFIDLTIETFECSIVIFGHPGKDISRGNRGSVIMEDWVDTCIEMKKINTDNAGLEAKITPKLFRHAELSEPFEITMDNFEFRLTNQPDSPEQLIIALANLHGGEVCPKDILDAGILPNTSLYKTLNQLVSLGIFEKSSRGKYKLVEVKNGL